MEHSGEGCQSRKFKIRESYIIILSIIEIIMPISECHKMFKFDQKYIMSSPEKLKPQLLI